MRTDDTHKRWSSYWKVSDSIAVRIIQIVDGDTLMVTHSSSGDRTPEHVRLYGIDAPELDQKYGREARKHLSCLVGKRDSRFFMNVMSQDIYGRSVAIVYRNSPYATLNFKMVNEGWAYWYEGYDQENRLRLREAQQIAFLSRKGVWQIGGNEERPWNYRIRMRQEIEAITRQTEDQQHHIANRARQQFQQRKTDRNRQVHALLRAGRDCHNRGEYANAIHHFNGAVSLEPNDATIYNDRGVAHRAIGEYDLAISDYSSAVRLNPNYGLAYSNRGNVYARKGEYELAILDYGRAIKLKDDCHSVYNNRGLAHATKGDYDSAILDFDRAIRLAPTRPQAYHNRALANARKGLHHRAIPDYDTALSLDSLSALTYFNRGLACLEMGLYKKAIVDFERVLRIRPEFNSASKYREVANSLRVRQSDNKASPFASLKRWFKFL